MVSWWTVRNFRTWNLRKALHLVWKAYPGTQVTSRTKQVHENDIVLQLHRSYVAGVPWSPAMAEQFMSTKCTVTTYRKPRKIKSIGQEPHPNSHWATDTITSLQSELPSWSSKVGTPPATTHTPAVQSQALLLWQARLSRIGPWSKKHCLLPFHLFPSYHSTSMLLLQHTSLKRPERPPRLLHQSPSPTSSHSSGQQSGTLCALKAK